VHTCAYVVKGVFECLSTMQIWIPGSAAMEDDALALLATLTLLISGALMMYLHLVGGAEEK